MRLLALELWPNLSDRTSFPLHYHMFVYINLERFRRSFAFLGQRLLYPSDYRSRRGTLSPCIVSSVQSEPSHPYTISVLLVC